MKVYLATTATVFGLLTGLHVWRAFAEGPQLAKEPFFILFTVAAAVLCLWACRLLILSSRK